MACYDFFKLWWYCCPGHQKPLNQRDISGDFIVPETIPDVRGDKAKEDYFGTGYIGLREPEFIDLSPIRNRQARYKEYHEALPPVEKKLNEICDEAVKIIFNKAPDLRNNLVIKHSIWSDDQQLMFYIKYLAIYGDLFLEKLYDEGRLFKLISLPAYSMYRIETVKGKLLEYQQSVEGPDYQSIARAPVETATKEDLAKATCVRFKPDEIVHIRLWPLTKGYYPYGLSLLERPADAWGEREVRDLSASFLDHYDEMFSDRKTAAGATTIQT